tara:strand:- start:685 stop:1119 length:435 start_codon:yes stop_codon:yes gene_type:complete
MNQENQNNGFTIDESKVREAMITLTQQKVSELSQQILVFQANCQVLIAECEKLTELGIINSQLQAQIETLKETHRLELESTYKEKVDATDKLSSERANNQDTLNKIETFYKPKVRELEKQILLLQKQIDDSSTKEQGDGKKQQK